MKPALLFVDAKQASAEPQVNFTERAVRLRSSNFKYFDRIQNKMCLTAPFPSAYNPCIQRKRLLVRRPAGSARKRVLGVEGEEITRNENQIILAVVPWVSCHSFLLGMPGKRPV